MTNSTMTTIHILILAGLALLAAGVPVREDAIIPEVDAAYDAEALLLLQSDHVVPQGRHGAHEAAPLQGKAAAKMVPAHELNDHDDSEVNSEQSTVDGMLAKDPLTSLTTTTLKSRVHEEANEATKEGEEDEEGGEKMTYYSKIKTVNIEAFAGLTAMLIFGTVLFEALKHKLIHTVLGTPMAPLVTNLFSELTTLGFLGIVTFLIGEIGLSHLSVVLFHGDKEGKAELGEMLEKIHMTIFFIMVLFLVEALGLLVMMRKQQVAWTEIESKVLMPSGRNKVLQDLKEADNGCFIPGELLFGGLTPRARRYLRAHKQVRFMLLRTEFIHFEELEAARASTRGTEKKSGVPGVKGGAHPVDHHNMSHDTALADRHMRMQFNFFLYLTKVLGERLAEVVEVSVPQWLGVMGTIFMFCVASILAGGYWNFLMWLILSVGWFMLFAVHMFWRMLKWQLAMITHADDPQLKDVTLTKIDAAAQPLLRNSDGTITTKPQNWISQRPQYLQSSADKPTHWLPEFLVGAPASSKNPNQQRMLNLMMFGRNEVVFHIVVLRAIFLGLAIYTAVFGDILTTYVAEVYTPLYTAVIGVMGLIPVVVIYFGYLFEVVQTAVMVTSVEHMRVRKVADQVVRYQKEHNAVRLMALIAVMLNSDGYEALTHEDVNKMKDCLEYDLKANREGKPADATTTLIASKLGDNGDTELVMARMISIFDSVDRDNSGELSLSEIHEIFKEIGFDSPEDVDACLQPMLKNIPISKIAPPAPAPAPPPRPPGISGVPYKDLRLQDCLPSKEPPVPEELPVVEVKAERTLSKPVFLSWFLALEKQAREQSAEQVAEFWFHLIDDDHSGSIGVAELQEVLQSCGKAFSADDVSALILELDANGDGEFDTHEFATWFSRHM